MVRKHKAHRRLLTVCWIVGLTFVCFAQIGSQDLFPSSISSSLDDIVRSIYDLDYDRAEGGLARIIKDYPDRPEGFFFEGAYFLFRYGVEGKYQTALLDSFRVYNDLAIETANRLVGNRSGGPAALFMLGGAYGYRARYFFERRSFFSAIGPAKDARRYLQEVLLNDTTVYDAYLGLGMFDYFTGNVPFWAKPIAFLLGISGDRSAGIAQLERAARQGRYARFEAADVLSQIYRYYENDPEQALATVETILSEFPGLKYFQIRKGLYQWDLGRRADAASTFELLTNSNLPSIHKRIANYYLGMIFYEMGRLDRSFASFATVDSTLPHHTDIFNVKAYYYSGLILQRERRYAEALQYFARTAELAESGQWKDAARAKIEELRSAVQQEENNARLR